MPFCPNPECPHIKKVGEPAEFREGVTNCSDCGTLLTSDITATVDVPNRSDFYKRIVFTLFMVILWRILAFIPSPGIDIEMKALSNYLGSEGSNIFFEILGLPRVSILALGLMPYLTAYVIVEIVSLIIPPLKSWRYKGYEGRAKLKRTALIATFLLAMIQGYYIVRGLETLFDGRLVHGSGYGLRFLVALTLTTGTFISIWIAELITKKGIGHGIGILILSSFATGILSKVFRLNINSEYLNHSPFEIVLFSTAVFLALIALIVFFETSSRKIPVKFSDGTEAFMPLKLTTAGIMPADWALSLIILPVTLVSFIDNSTIQSIAFLLIPGTLVHAIVYAITIFLLCYFFTALFYRPQKMINFLKSKNAYISLSSEGNVGKHIDKTLEIMAFWAALYLCVVVITPNILIKNSFFPVFLGGVALIEAVAISLDLLGELKIRRKNKKLVKIAEFHNIQVAGLCKSLLEQYSITCCLRGYYFRALLYFFGPYIEISAMVPEDKAEKAIELVKRYIEQ